ncbi:glycoside hydrolase family 130 protein [Amnibacterium sp.]|uniref:glycoside hydrolase family 130 protein n=1 Tax=Amnibacterium sp. TaxID=1872496 RepID=UPI002605AF9A|nr:glycoside hydrolase family 130 protein [Amnibacterium sp.]
MVAQLFLPGEGVASTHSRAAQIVDRVLALPGPVVSTLAHDLVADFGPRHVDTVDLLRANARAVGSRVQSTTPISDEQSIVLGATFTAEYAIEGAALCNPSAVEHPDQSGLQPGQLRVAVALRAIGEGHVSSIEFTEAVIGPGDAWSFVPRRSPVATATILPARWHSSRLRAALEHEDQVNELTSWVLDRLPPIFTGVDVEAAIAALPPELLHHRDSGVALNTLRDMVSSAYIARFDPDTDLGQRVLLPAAVEEHNGMEDARLVRFTADDGSTAYRATYTAYDGRDIAPRLITTPDLVSFSIHRLSGPSARNKGMALFPRTVGGRHLALARTDGESISLASSPDGFVWSGATLLNIPVEPWEMVQTGNCGSPIETDRGWLVLTHGVGPFRVYSISAILLDLDDPSVVLGRARRPILQPEGPDREGYVPNVVYSCGGIVHDGRLWVPIGIGDAQVGVFSTDLEELLDFTQASRTPALT